jgi:hypothetical protein
MVSAETNDEDSYCIAMLVGAVAPMAGAEGERVPGADCYGAVEPSDKVGPEVLSGPRVSPAQDVVAHERGRWC